VEFTVNNKAYSATKVSLFIVKYGRKLRIGANIKKSTGEIKQQADKGKREDEEWKKRDKIILSIKDLVFKEQLANK